MNLDRKKELQEKVTSGFLGFWIRNYRLSYLATAVVILLGMISIIQIPKESMPKVELGAIVITTAHPWANPQDIDSQITDKIYKAIKNVDGISKITSTSSVGVSSVTVTLKTWIEIKDARTDIQAKVDGVTLPKDAMTPTLTTVETDTNAAFSLYLYHKNNSATTEELMNKANILKKNLETLSEVDKISVLYNPIASGFSDSSDDSDYNVHIIIENEKLDAYGLNFSHISQAVSSFNTDIPIGNFSIDDKKYDYRIGGKNIYASDFLNIPISLPSGGNIKLWDIASIERKYSVNKSATVMVQKDEFSSHKAIGINIGKTDSASLFSATKQAKEMIEKKFQEQEFLGYDFFYTADLAEIIGKDYKDLFWNFISTLSLVFVVMLIFVGFVDSIFSVLVLPLAFLATFTMLNAWGFTMNFLTNFSLIISLGIAIDTIIVFVQAASAKIRIGYEPQTAIILAFKEYAMSIIVGTLTTIMVFIPIMSLPGVMWRFLAFIPVTIFGVLFFGLIFALTINGALYKGIIRPKKTYTENKNILEYATREQKELLLLEREGKILTPENNSSLRAKIIFSVVEKYKNFIDTVIRKKFFRMLAIFLPVGFFFFGIIFLSPLINFELMPADDNNEIAYTLKSAVWTTREAMDEKIWNLEEIFKPHPEIKNVSIITAGNQTSINIALTNKEDREKLGQMSAFELDEKLLEKISVLSLKWIEISGWVLWNWPPSEGDVGIKIISSSQDNLEKLIAVAKDFENFIASLDETKNISNSAEDTPWQFVLSLKKDLINLQNISPNLIYQTISEYTNGVTIGQIDDNEKEIDIILKNNNFLADVTPDKILNIPLVVGKNIFRIGDFMEVVPLNAISSISRTNGKIQIALTADMVEGANSIETTQKILDFAKNYNFPDKISYEAGWAQSENSDLIISMITSLVLAMIGIFAVLTWQFNSYAKPAMVFYSVIMAFPFVLLGLIITGNPYSLMFGIGFIALMGISVNHGIILLEWVDQNLKKWMNGFMALIESSSSRLEPMLLTTLTTVLGMVPLSLTGAMWAGLAWTIIFGLMATTFIALFSLGPLYYELFIKEKKKKPNIFVRIFKKFFTKKSQNLRENIRQKMPENIISEEK